MFDKHYDDWREKRVRKIVKIFGESFFENKTLLELGAGTGKNGKMFEQMGSKVTYAEARQEHLNVLLENDPHAETILLDQDYEWNLNRKFDVIVHWGVLYHLRNWRQDLICATQHSNLIFLESLVSVSEDPEHEIILQEEGYDQAINGFGSRPSAPMIEAHLNQLGCKFTRYDDSDLNSSFHQYDWIVSETNPEDVAMGCRRFWIVEKEEIK